MSIAEISSTLDTFADVLERVGDVPAERILLHPPPGSAKAADVEAVRDRHHRLAELVDGVLVEKTMGIHESLLAGFLIQQLRNFLEGTNRGYVTGPDGPILFSTQLVRIPDVAFFSPEKFNAAIRSEAAIPAVVPDLAIEILSRGNSPAEMRRKREDYFAAGVQLVWEIDHRSKTVLVYTGVENATTLSVGDEIDGGAVLPGFRLSVARILAELE